MFISEDRCLHNREKITNNARYFGCWADIDVFIVTVDQKLAVNEDFDNDDDVYDELLSLKLDDDWFTSSTPPQPGMML